MSSRRRGLHASIHAPGRGSAERVDGDSVVSYVLSTMTLLMKKLRELRSAREAIGEAAAFHAQSRSRISELAERGDSNAALAESASLLGLDMSRRPEARIVRFKGVRV